MVAIMDTQAVAELTQHWLKIEVRNQQELELAFSLAVDLKGQPVRWSAGELGIIMLASESESRDFHPFPSPPSAPELVAFFRSNIPSELPRHGGSNVVAEVLVPRMPDMGGIGGWSALNLLFWHEDPHSLVKFIIEEQ